MATYMNVERVIIKMNIYTPDKECFDNCPNDKEYIGNEKNCLTKEECIEKGLQYYYLFLTVNDQKIYKCINYCLPNFPILVKKTNKCVERECPSNHIYLRKKIYTMKTVWILKRINLH